MVEERDRRPPQALKSASWAPPAGFGAPAPSPLSRVTAALAAAGAVLGGLVLGLVFAATLVLALILGALALTLAALAWRLRAGRPLGAEARAPGHSWVAYSLDRRL